MADIDVLTQRSLHRSALAARQFVQRLASSQVLLTDVRPVGPDEFRAVARWPRAHAGTDPGGPARLDPLLVAETLRQLAIYLPLRFYGVTAESRLLVEELRFSLNPDAEPCSRAGSEVTCAARAVRRFADGTAGEHMRSLDLGVRLLAEGQEFASADVVARVLCPAAYRAVRHRGNGNRNENENGNRNGNGAAASERDAAPNGDGVVASGSGAAGAAGAAGATGAADGVDGVDGAPERNGAAAEGHGPVGATDMTGAARGAGAAGPGGAAAPFTAADRAGLTAVDPARVGASRPRDVLVAVDGRGAVRIAPADPFHPFLHDHPGDHITGMTLIGALQQTAALQANEPRLRLRSCTLRALRFTEPSPPPTVEIGPAGRFEIRQRGSVTATGEAQFEL